MPTDRALLIGVNNYQYATDLRGCIRDISNWQQFLIENRMGVAYQVNVLLDATATYANLVEACRWLFDMQQPGDHRLLVYSGHGSYTRDLNGDEPDRVDELICPVDYAGTPPFFSDDLVATLIGAVPAGCHTRVFLDSCHAGTMLRVLPAVDGGRKRLPKVWAPEAAMLDRKEPARHGWRSWVGMPPVADPLAERVAAQGALLLAATRPWQLAADAYINGQYQGAHTRAFLDNWRPNEAAGATRKRMKLWLDGAGYGGSDGQCPTLYGPTTLRHQPFFGI